MKIIVEASRPAVQVAAIFAPVATISGLALSGLWLHFTAKVGNAFFNVQWLE